MTGDSGAAGDGDILGEHDLVIVGRYAVTDGSDYYLPEQRGEFLRAFARPFRSATYVCYVRDKADSAAYVPVDSVGIELAPNEVWNSEASTVRRLNSLRGDIAAVPKRESTVTYTYYPGTYSFLLAPGVLRRGDTNVAYFGKAAGVSADGLENGRLLTRLQRRLYPRAEKYVIDRADVTFVRDPRVQADESETVKLSKPVTDVIPDGRLEPSSEPFSDPIRLLYVGSFRPTKGQEYLVDALAHLCESTGRDYRLRFVGDGTTRERIERQVRDRDLETVVEFTGHIADTTTLRDEYEGADLFVLPSETEGFPRVINEAMAMGLPVVATRVGGIPALLDDEEHAVLVNPKDPAAIAVGVETVVEDPQLRERLLTRGAEFANEHSGDPVEQHLDAIRRRVA